MKWLKVLQRKPCSSYGNEKTWVTGHKLVKYIVINDYDFNLEEEKEDAICESLFVEWIIIKTQVQKTPVQLAFYLN